MAYQSGEYPTESLADQFVYTPGAPQLLDCENYLMPPADAALMPGRNSQQCGSFSQGTPIGRAKAVPRWMRNVPVEKDRAEDLHPIPRYLQLPDECLRLP